MLIVSSHRLKLDPSKPQLTKEERETLGHNIQLLRDIIVLFTATGSARGVSGHTGEYTRLLVAFTSKLEWTLLGGAYDTIPEVCMLLSLFEGSEKYLPIIFDEAGK
jgi:hypothetical protein